MKNKNKLGLSLLTGLTTLSVATPLATSCAKTNKYINHVHESEEDKLYGINANTYESLKKDYTNQLQDQMLEHGFIEGSEEWQKEMNNLNYSLNAFDDKSKTMEMSYGDLTSGLMTYAKRNNGLTLHRTTTAKPSDVDDMYQGARNSFDLYMDQLGFSSSLKAQVFTDADNKFATLKKQLQTKGTMENDPYGALQEARSSLLGFFDLVNAEISRFASLSTISNFRKLYTLVYKDTTCLNDLLENPGFQKGKPLSEKLMNQIFDCIDNENGSTTTFRTDIMTGYVLTPTLKEVKIDNKTNQHEIDIEWSCISNTYINSNDAETIKTATAYDYESNNDKVKQLLKVQTPTINQVFDSFEIKSIPTSSILSINKEKENLKNTYFNPNVAHIEFKFPDASDKHASLDPFYMSSDCIYTDEQGTHDGELSLDSLAATGMMISSDGGETYEYLSDVIASINLEGFDSSNATLAQQFILNCTVNGKIHQIDKANHEISIELHAKYCNSTYAKDKIDENWLAINTKTCSNYPISEMTFQNFSRNYSKACEYAKMYKETKINSQVESVIIELVFSCVGAAIMGTLVGLNIACLVKAIKTENVRSLPTIILALVSSLAGIGFAFYGIGIFSKKIDEGKQFSNSLNTFIKSDLVQELFRNLDRDSKIYAIYNASDGYQNYSDSQSVYNAKYNAFKNGDIEHFMKLNIYYNSISKEDGPLNTLAKAMPIDVTKKAYQNAINNLSKNDTQIKTARLITFIGLGVFFGLSLILTCVNSSILMNKQPTVNEVADTIVEQEVVETTQSSIWNGENWVTTLLEIKMLVDAEASILTIATLHARSRMEQEALLAKAQATSDLREELEKELVDAEGEPLLFEEAEALAKKKYPDLF